MLPELENCYKPLLEQANLIQEALMPLGYVIKGIRKKGPYSLLLHLSGIQLPVGINETSGIVENMTDISSINDSDNTL